MYQTPEQLVAFNKANLEVAMKFAGIALQGAERMLDLQLKAAKSAFADSVESAKAIAAVKDLQQLASLKDSLAQPAAAFHDIHQVIDNAILQSKNHIQIAEADIRVDADHFIPSRSQRGGQIGGGGGFPHSTLLICNSNDSSHATPTPQEKQSMTDVPRGTSTSSPLF